MTHEDIDAGLGLSAQAGWNQIAADWRLLIDLWPGTCFAGWRDGRVIATGTVAQYGSGAGWIGMILVDEAQRGCGVGTRMLEHVIAVADKRGVAQLGLDATDLGRPIYERLGFVEQCAMGRWAGLPGEFSDDAAVAAVTHDDWPGIVELDRAAVGVDRGALLRKLAGERGAIARVVKQGGRVTAFGLARRGRQAGGVGPVVAQSPVEAQALLEALLGAGDADVPVLIDVADHSPLASLLSGYGFTRQRRLTRMVRPGASRPMLTGAAVFAAAGFELG